MKRSLLLLVFVVCTFVALAHPPVSEKVKAIFDASFPSARSVVWTEFDNFYQVYFVKDDIQCRVYYDFNGNVIRSRRDYSGDNLNPFLTAKLLTRFPGRKIFVVNEVSTDQETFYLVHLEGATEWIQVRCDPTGDISVVNKLKKG